MTEMWRESCELLFFLYVNTAMAPIKIYGNQVIVLFGMYSI